jgi:hypothetical protein
MVVFRAHGRSSLRYWMGMFADGANLSASPAKYHAYCGGQGGCAPTTPPYTMTAPIKYWGISPAPNTTCKWTFNVGSTY